MLDEVRLPFTLLHIYYSVSVCLDLLVVYFSANFYERIWAASNRAIIDNDMDKADTAKVHMTSHPIHDSNPSPRLRWRSSSADSAQNASRRTFPSCTSSSPTMRCVCVRFSSDNLVYFRQRRIGMSSPVLTHHKVAMSPTTVIPPPH